MADESRADDRRAFTRYAVWFPVTLVVDEGEVGGICRDASAGGLQVSAGRLVDVGASVEVRFRVTPRGTPDHRIRAEVVRAEANDGELVLAFPYRMALRFEQPIPELPDELAAQATLLA